LTVEAPPAMAMFPSPGTARARSNAASTPSVTKWNVVPPSMTSGSRGWWVSTKTGAWYGGSGPHHPCQSPLHSPRTGPNMLRPMMNARACRIAASSAWFSSGVSNIHEWSCVSSASPNGRSSVWFSPAE
jgi:hypothetical protein